ncbi:MAG: hypothetical protein GXP46_06505 [Deferribacteres bacterium]|nr:hypothetical protein [Deferribacteres bacterium]
MRRFLIGSIAGFLLLFPFFYTGTAAAWHTQTHLAVARAAGYRQWYNAAAADITKIKAGSIESYNHFFNNPRNAGVTPEMVLTQADRYNMPSDTAGHLYGAIVGSLREYSASREKGRYAEYHLAFTAHYITDLSQPLHNIPYDEFNRENHQANDGVVDGEVLKNIDRIKRHMYPVKLRPGHFEKDLAAEIARVAEISRRLGLRLKKEGRIMTSREAYTQLGHSASLLRAVLQYHSP